MQENKKTRKYWIFLGFLISITHHKDIKIIDDYIYIYIYIFLKYIWKWIKI